jgi:hypothetical protein
MTKAKKAQKSHLKAVTGSNRVESGIYPATGSLIGSTTPRIASKPSELPSKGTEMIEFARSIGMKLMPWQEWLAMESHRVKPDGRWLNSQICVVVARQSGKTTFQIMRALTGLFVWNEPLQIGTAHRLTTSLETFRHMVSIIEANAVLSSQVKRIRWAHGSEEIELLNGNRYMVKAGGAAARGISRPETIFLDELREMKDLDSFASLRYTAMASKNPMVIGLSNAGDQHSVVLNQLRERGLAAASGAADDIGYFEWSAATDDINDPENWKAANPALGYTVHEDNIRAVLNDPPDVVRTEVLCRWVATISSAIPQDAWNECGEDDLQLDPLAPTWLGLDFSPDRRSAALVGAQKMSEDRFQVRLLHTWTNPIALDDRAVANDVATYARKYATETVAFSRRTAAASAMRLQPAGISITDIDGAIYAQACDELLGAITSRRLRHANQPELTSQVLSAARLRMGDTGWVIGRRASQSTVTACVAAALVSHFATRPSTEIDILVG